MVSKVRTSKSETLFAAPAALARPAHLEGHDAQAALAAVELCDDLVEYQMRCFLALAPGFSEAVARQVAAHVRDNFGGAKVYVGRRAGEGMAARNEAIRRDHKAGEQMGLLERRYNMSRTQLWRIVNGMTSGH